MSIVMFRIARITIDPILCYLNASTYFNGRHLRTNHRSMKTRSTPILITAIIGLSAFTAINSSNWTIAEGYSVKFSSEDPTGVFEKMKGTVVFDEKDLTTASFNVAIDVNSINTGNGMMNRHAVSEKWFDAEKFPEITFVSERVAKTEAGYDAIGKLSVHGVTKDFTIPFTFAANATGGVFTGAFDVSRLAFGIGEAGKVSDIMKMEVSVPVKN